MAKTRAEIVQLIQVELEDRNGQIWTTTDIGAAIDRALLVLSESCPPSAKDAVAFEGDTTRLDISEIDDLIEVEGVMYPQIEEGTKPTGSESWRNWSELEDGVIDVSLSEAPSAGEYADVYYSTVHTLSDTATTLRPNQESVVVDLATAYCLMKKPLYYVNVLLVDNLWTKIDSALSRIRVMLDGAENDFASGRKYIGARRTEAETAIADVSSRITQVTADLQSERIKLDEHVGDAIVKIDAMSADITQALADLTTGRAKIDDLRTTADAELDKVATQVAQAVTDAGSLRTYANSVNIGDPLTAYSRALEGQLGASAGYIGLARGFMQEHTVAGEYARYSSTELQAAMAKLSQARGYLAADQPSAEYGALAAREMQSAQLSLAQARAYMAQDTTAETWVKYASAQVQAANGAAAEANQEMQKLKLKIQSTSLSETYYPKGKERLAAVQPSLQKLAVSYSHRCQGRGNYRDWPED